jgi:integrase
MWTECVDVLSRRFAVAAKAAGFDLTLHSLRHSCASRLIQRGVPVPVVAKILGHKCHTTTLRYVHLAPGATHEAIRSLDSPMKAARDTQGDTQGVAAVKA